MSDCEAISSLQPSVRRDTPIAVRRGRSRATPIAWDGRRCCGRHAVRFRPSR